MPDDLKKHILVSFSLTTRVGRFHPDLGDVN